MNDFWTLVGGCSAVMFVAAAIFCLMGHMMLVILSDIRGRLAKNPVNGIVVSALVGICVAFGGTKPPPPPSNPDYYVLFQGNVEPYAQQAFCWDEARELYPYRPIPVDGGPLLKFDGWAETEDGPAVFANRQVVSNLTDVAGGKVTLYPVTHQVRLTISFENEGGTGTMEDCVFNWVNGVNPESYRLPPNRFAKDGFTFIGWAESPMGPVAYAPEASVPDLYGMEGSMTLFAVWEKTPPPPTTYKLTVKATKSTCGSVTIKDGKKTVKSGSKVAAGTELSLAAKAKSGYVFAGWYTDKDCKKKLNPEGYDYREPKIKYTMPAKTTALYAKFVSKSSDKSELKFSSATQKLAKTAKSFTVGKTMSTLTLSVSSASLPTLSMKGLPNGMSFDPATGEITGKPTKPGKYTATVTVKSAAGNSISQKVKINVTVPSGYYGTFDGYALVKTTPAYMTFTSDKYGAVSGKVTYKGKGYKFTASYSSASATKSKFTPSIKIGSKTYKPVTYVEKLTDGITVSEARGEQKGKFLFVAQKKPELVKVKKALAGLIDQTMTVKASKYADAKLPKSSDYLKLKFAATDAVKVSGKLNGKSVSFSTTVIYCGMKGDAACGPEDVVYVAEVALIEPKSGYSRLATFTLTAGKDGKVTKVEKAFSVIK